jgi:hypothetical protein
MSVFEALPSAAAICTPKRLSIMVSSIKKGTDLNLNSSGSFFFDCS